MGAAWRGGTSVPLTPVASMRRFADPLYFPDLHRRQVIESIRRASPGLIRARVTVAGQAETPDALNAEGLTDHHLTWTGSDGRSIECE